MAEMRVFAERLLARREYGVAELHARLLNKWSGQGGAGERVGVLIEALQSEGSLSDERFVESFVRSRRIRFQGPAKIKAELRQRRVPEAIIAAGLRQDSGEWTALATAWLSRQCAGSLNYAERAKYYRRMLNRGFTHQQAMDALSRESDSLL